MYTLAVVNMVESHSKQVVWKVLYKNIKYQVDRVSEDTSICIFFLLLQSF
jgi:hypothetical protein